MRPALAEDTAVIALDTALHFLRAVELIDPEFFAAHVTDAEPAPQRILQVTAGIATETDEFRFAEDFSGLETFAKAGTVIATDGDKEVKTPHDDCILVMPNPPCTKGHARAAFRPRRDAVMTGDDDTRAMALEMAQALSLVRAGHTLYADILAAVKETVGRDGNADIPVLVKRLNEAITHLTRHATWRPAACSPGTIDLRVALDCIH